LLLLAANLIGLNAWAWKEQASWQSRRSAIDSTLTRTFPAVKVVVDAPVQMAREVAALRQATGAPSGSDLEVDPDRRRRTALPQGKAPTGNRLRRWRGPAQGAQPRPRRTGRHDGCASHHGLFRPDGR
jgi:hypothetical protein